MSRNGQQPAIAQRSARTNVCPICALAAALLLSCGGKTRQLIADDNPTTPGMSSQPEPQPDLKPDDLVPAEPGGQEPDEMEPPIETEPPDEMPEPPACAGDAPFSEPIELYLDSAFSIGGAWLSDDGLELVVGARADAEAQDTNAFDLVRAERTDPAADFGAFIAIEELNTALLERNPTLSPDGLTIYFESDRSGESSDIYVAERASRGAAFGEARLAQAVSTKRNDVPGAVSRFTNALFFSADRLGGPGQENLYQAERQANDSFAETFLISSVDSDGSNVAPAPSSDELTIYFSSNRDSPDLTHDIYRARRSSLTAFFGLPLPVAELSSNAGDIVAWLSADECTILLTRETPLGTGHIALFMAER